MTQIQNQSNLGVCAKPGEGSKERGAPGKSQAGSWEGALGAGSGGGGGVWGGGPGHLGPGASDFQDMGVLVTFSKTQCQHLQPKKSSQFQYRGSWLQDTAQHRHIRGAWGSRAAQGMGDRKQSQRRNQGGRCALLDHALSEHLWRLPAPAQVPAAPP